MPHRKAYRLGKFLQDVNGLRKLQLLSGGNVALQQQQQCQQQQQQYLLLLEVLVYLGEGTYYFLDQFTW